MKPTPQFGAPKPGHRTGPVCTVCGSHVLSQEKFGSGGALSGYRLVCSKRGCPWQSSAPLES